VSLRSTKGESGKLREIFSSFVTGAQISPNTQLAAQLTASPPLIIPDFVVEGLEDTMDGVMLALRQ